MAKDLPYFKFFCSEWNDGDITLETYEHQGLFINICSYYWSNECNLHFDKLLKRFRSCEELIDDLSAAGLFKIKEDRFISISFLDEQREERDEQSKKSSKAGIASAKARKLKKLKEENNIDSTQIQRPLNLGSTETQPLREEEIRKENILYTQTDFLNDWKKARLHYDKQITNITSLKAFELIAFNKILKDYGSDDFYKAINGLFFQDTYKQTRLRPTHFLDNFETYLTCWQTKEKLFEVKKKETKL